MHFSQKLHNWKYVLLWVKYGVDKILIICWIFYAFCAQFDSHIMIIYAFSRTSTYDRSDLVGFLQDSFSILGLCRKFSISTGTDTSTGTPSQLWLIFPKIHRIIEQYIVEHIVKSDKIKHPIYKFMAILKSGKVDYSNECFFLNGNLIL